MGFRPHAIALLKQTSIFKWCMARLVVENLHQKDRCQDEIETFVLNWINEHNRESPLYVNTFDFCFRCWFLKYFTLTFYNFLRLNDDASETAEKQTTRAWFAFADMMEQLPIQSDCKNWVWRWRKWRWRTFMYILSKFTLLHHSAAVEYTRNHWLDREY